MKNRRTIFVFTLAGVCLAVLSAGAFQPVPKESGKALGVTRGKPFSKGHVFVDGKYVPPPYVVERWGTGLRINSIPVTDQVVPWDEFVRTQVGATASTQTVEVVSVRFVTETIGPAPEAEPAKGEDDGLDELFGDDYDSPDAKAKEKERKKEKPKTVTKRIEEKVPKTVVTYSLTGDFVPNDASKALLGRINKARTEIDRILRADGFACFGGRYAQVTGDRRAAQAFLKVVTELQLHSESAAAFYAGARSANLVCLTKTLCEDLFRNRLDCRKIRERQEKLDSDRELKRIVKEVLDPVF